MSGSSDRHWRSLPDSRFAPDEKLITDILSLLG